MTKILNVISSSALLYKLCKWVVASSTGLIAVPVALLAIIVSLNTSIFKDSDKSVRELLRLETHYNLLEEQKQIQEDSLAIPPCTVRTLAVVLEPCKWFSDLQHLIALLIMTIFIYKAFRISCNERSIMFNFPSDGSL
jgi:hypothetical protein